MTRSDQVPVLTHKIITDWTVIKWTQKLWTRKIREKLIMYRMIEEWTSPGTGMINATTERETEVFTLKYFVLNVCISNGFYTLAQAWLLIYGLCIFSNCYGIKCMSIQELWLAMFWIDIVVWTGKIRLKLIHCKLPADLK